MNTGMHSVPKPTPHIGPGERYMRVRQLFLQHKWSQVLPVSDDQPIHAFEESNIVERRCECAYPLPCPRGLWVPVERVFESRPTGVLDDHGLIVVRPVAVFKTGGHVHHKESRSRAPGRREDLTNLFLLAPRCHQGLHSPTAKAA